MKTKKEKHDDRAHAPLPPSASSRWLKCHPSMAYVASLIKRKVIKKRESGEAAKRGTRIHEAAAPAIEQLIKGKGAAFPKGEEGALAKLYACFCEDIYHDARLLHDTTQYGVEAEAWVTDECWGSTDFWCYSAKRFIVVDLKTGREPVDARGNTQLLIYAIGVMRKRKLAMPKEVEVIIYQPGNGPDNCSRYVYSWNEFIEATKSINHGIEEASKYFKANDAKIEKHLVAGDHCEWCDAIGVCDRAKQYALAASAKNFQPVPVERSSPPAPSKLEPDQVGLILERAAMFKAWLDAVEVRALELIAKGHRVPGFKVVPKITRRAWESGIPPGKIAKGLGLKLEEIQETRLLSPAKVEALLDRPDRKKLDKYVFKPIGEPTVVAESDKRQALPSTKISFTPVSRTEESDG